MPAPLVSDIDGMTERQRLAAGYLASGKTNREVARLLGVSERTIWGYRKRPAVQRAILAAQNDIMELSGAQNLTLIPDAIQCLRDIINDPEARDSDKIAASRALMSGANSFSERRLLERQLADLERALQRHNAAEGATPIEEEPLDPLLPSADPADYED